MRVRVLLGAALLAMAPAWAGAQGPASTYYLTNGDAAQNWRVQGLSAVSSAQANPNGGGSGNGEYAIAVSSDIRTLGNGNSGADSVPRLGSLYNLNFVYQGVDYPYPTLGTRSFYDGTTDGTFIYSLDYNSGEVVRMNNDWTGVTALFNTGFGSTASIGITYDGTDGTLWTASFNTNEIRHFTMGGALLGSFNASFFTGSLTALAWDPRTDTLWMGSQNNQGTFAEYSKTGTLLQSQVYASMAAENTLGGEFQISAVPEPTSWALATAGLGAAIATRQRRRQATATA